MLLSAVVVTGAVYTVDGGGMLGHWGWPAQSLGVECSVSRGGMIGHQRQDAHAYGICTPFYCISLKEPHGGMGDSAANDWKIRNIKDH